MKGRSLRNPIQPTKTLQQIITGFHGPMNGYGIHVGVRRLRRVHMSRRRNGYF
jgi:hypothetical protein